MVSSESKSFVYVRRIFLVIAALFLARLVFLQVFVSGEYSANASEIRTISYDTTPHRGTIYDRNGTVLAVSVDAVTIYCNPKEVTNVDYEARKLASVLGGSDDDYRPMLERDDTPFVYIKRQADVDVADKVKELGLDGIYFLNDSRREYPNGSIGGQVIGACDPDGNGICGLELYYDEILKGSAGTYSAERSQKGTPIPSGVHKDVQAIDGQDIMISLDIQLQDSVEKALAKNLESVDIEHGSAIVMDSETGEIFAMCSYPYLDPGNLDQSLVGSDNLLPITTHYEPGSVMKGISALAILEEDALSPSDSIYCPAELKVGDDIITDSHERPSMDMTFSQILEQSSNIGISLATKEMGFTKLYDILKRMKFSEATGVDYPGETAGTLLDLAEWSEVGGYNISFGQGMSATPLQVTRAYGAIANDGVITQPHFLIAKPQTDEQLEYPTEQVIEDKQALEELKGMLRNVVLYGTGQNAAISGFDVAGKTSTAEIYENGEYKEGVHNLFFTGFIDNSSSPLVCMVGANDVPYERNMAGVFRDIMLNVIDLYNVVPE